MIAAPTGVRRPRGASVVLVATLGAGVVVHAQQTSPPLEVSKLAPAALEKYAAAWRAAARTHAAGRFDEPAAAIARWPAGLTHEVIERTLASRVVDEDHAAVIAKGLLLHTDIALAVRTGEAGTTTGTLDLVMLDAKPYGSRLFSIHWSHARVLADALVKARAGRPARNASGASSIATARAWYRAIGALFQQWADLGRLHTHLDHAGGVLGEDPVLLLYEGTLRQAYADARLQSFLVRHRQSVRALPEGIPLDRNVYGGPLRFDSAGMELEGAEHALRRALALDPSLVEARIRLAHVRGARGKPAEAATLSRQALAEPLPPFLEFYAAMVLGRAEIRLGEPAQAHAAFQRAAARYPRSQAARVALSHVAIGGSPGIAAEALVRALGPDGLAVTDDPWALYFRLHEPDAPALFQSLRTSVP